MNDDHFPHKNRHNTGAHFIKEIRNTFSWAAEEVIAGNSG
jgi:hypothetical protein